MYKSTSYFQVKCKLILAKFFPLRLKYLKIGVTLIFLFLLWSCHTTKYTHSGNVNSIIDFREGNWILNFIDAPSRIRREFTDKTEEQLRGYLGNRLKLPGELKSAILPDIKDDVLNESALEDIQTGTGFDYFIQVKAKVLRNESDSFQIGSVRSRKKNKVMVSFIVYDLNLKQQIYLHNLIAELTVEPNNQDFAIANGVTNMMSKGLDKILKKIDKNCIY